MIEQIKVYAVSCDKCSDPLFLYGDDYVAHHTEESEAKEAMEDAEWKEIDGKQYCPNCYTQDEDGNDIVKL